MGQLIVVCVIIAAALLLAGRSLRRALTGKGGGCGACPGECGSGACPSRKFYSERSAERQK